MNWRVVGISLAAVLAGGLAGAAQAQGRAPTGAWVAPPRPVWAGEVFDLTLRWRVDWSSFQNLDGDLAWTSDPLVAEPFAPPALGERSPDGWTTILLKTRAMALQPGRVTLQPARQSMIVQTGVVDMEEYRRAITGPVTVRSAAGVLDVRPLPPAPAGFSGAVGQFTVASSVDRTEVKVGDPVTWTVTLEGVGNWPALHGLPARQVSRDFQVLGAPKWAEDKAASLFERTVRETVTLVPQRAGTYVLGAFEVVAFDPRGGRYVTLRAPAVTLTIKPGPHGDLIPAAASPLAAGGQDALPRLLDGQGRALAPPGAGAWLASLAGAPLAVLAAWLLLALRRAWREDPDRAARGAHRRLQATLAALHRAAEDAERRRSVRAWQRDAAVRWKFGRAAPTPASFGPAGDWSRLWAEADRYLYGPAAALPQDWPDRATGALAELGAPAPFAPADAFRRANLLPTACLAAALLAFAAPQGVRAAQPRDEAALRQAVAGHPLDWRARHNLAVTLAARERWDEAAGQAAVAWLQQPAAPETRAFWRRAAAKAGYSLDPRASVPRPQPGWMGAVSLLSPAGWRLLAIALAWTCALGFAGLLVARFYPRWRWTRFAGVALVALSASAGVVAAGALYVYGGLASPAAAILWKAGPLRALPVDTPAETARVQLPAGAAGRVDRSFLGWRRLRLDDGRTGWVRRESLVWVWSAGQ